MIRKLLIVWAFTLAATQAIGQASEPNYFAAVDKPMSFIKATSGGNCHTCNWIAAQGTITRETVRDFDLFLEEQKFDDLYGVAIHLNSPGGSLLGALELGERIRAMGANTVVAETSGIITEFGVRDLFLETDDAQCASACVFVFSAGINRFAADHVDASSIGYQKLGRLGVHQFYDPLVVNQGPETEFDGWARSNDQVLTGLILEYLDRMGVSPRVLSYGMSVRPWEPMKWLSQTEITSLGLDTSTQPVKAKLLGYSNGVGVIEVAREGRNGTYRYEFFCSSAGKLMFQISATWKSGFTADDLEEWNLLAQLKLRHFPDMYRTKQTFKVNDAGRLQSVSLYQGNQNMLTQLKKQKSFSFEGASSSHGWQFASDFDFFFEEPFDGFYLLPRLCIQ